MAILENESQSTDLKVNDIIDLLGDESEEEKPIEKKEEKEEDKPLKIQEEEEEEEEEEKKKDKEEEEEEGEKKLELEEEEELDKPAPRKKEIEKAFPGFFKKFPEVEREYYFAQQVKEVFPSLDDAKEAYDKSRALDSFEEDIDQGNTRNMLIAIKNKNTDAFNLVVDHYLDNLHAVDKDAYTAVVSNVFKDGIRAIVKAAGASRNEDVREAYMQAARVFNNYLFESDEEIPANIRLSKNKNPEEDKVKKEREEFNNERLTTSQEDVADRSDRIIEATIKKHIDPKNVMTPYVKRNAIKEAMESVEELISKDNQFRALQDKRWQSHIGDKFSRTTLDKVLNAYLGRAQALLPDVIKKVRQDALRDRVSARPDRDRKGQLPHRLSGPTERENRQEGKTPSRRKSTLDFLNED